jgi:hypothetical protein
MIEVLRSIVRNSLTPVKVGIILTNSKSRFETVAVQADATGIAGRLDDGGIGFWPWAQIMRADVVAEDVSHSEFGL